MPIKTDKKYKILLIEDEKDLAEIFAMKLELDGFRVLVEASGAAGIKTAKKEKPDLILLDLVIPDIDGFMVLKELKKDSQMKNCLIYAWTNITYKKKLQAAARLGADGCILKSDYTPSTLSAKVKEILKIK